jgi:hypothetical protein
MPGWIELRPGYLQLRRKQAFGEYFPLQSPDLQCVCRFCQRRHLVSNELDLRCHSASNELDQRCRSVEQPHLRAVQPC